MRAVQPRLFSLLPLFFFACAPPETDPGTDLEEAEDEADVAGGKADAPGWTAAETIHLGEARFDFVGPGDRRVHAVWSDAGVPLDIAVEAAEEGTSVRVAVLGPLVSGQRAVIAADGYTSRKGRVEVSPALSQRGQHLVVIGSYRLETAVSYRVSVRCAPGGDCPADRVDVLSSPKLGALVGDPDRLLAANLGLVMADRDFDIEMEVWTAPPAQRWNAELASVSVASGSQVNAILPDTIAAGDDVVLVLRDAAGAVLDTGVLGRFAPAQEVFARLDSIMYGDLVAVTVSGVTGYTEGAADFSLRSEDRDIEIERATLHAELPGQVGNGFGAFDVTFAPWIADDDGNINPDLPRNGELLSVGRLNGNGDYLSFGCFEYCNDLSGMESCTGGPRPCP
jgi:hypothetical protein